jgi:hypothetical protein
MLSQYWIVTTIQMTVTIKKKKNNNFLESTMDPQQPNLRLNEYLTFFRTVSEYIIVLCNFYIFFSFVPQLHFASSLV